MTETLGWGDLDVEGDAPRRRRVRVPPVLVWVIVAVVIAAFALWPTARRHLSDQAAAWLQKQWATAQAYDASRQSIERSVALRVGVGDTERYTRIIRYLDQLEARRLTSIGHSVTGARSWSGDVRRAGETVRRALAAEAHDLVQDAAQAADAVAALPSPPSATSLVTDALIQTAGTAVADVARRHHVSKARPSKAHLTAPASLVAPLYRVTDAPLDAELAVTHGHAIDIWNLRTGTRERTIEGPQLLDSEGVESDIGPPTFIGRSLFFSDFQGRSVLTPLDGRPPVSLPAAQFGYSSAAGEGLWLMNGDSVRRYDAEGRPVGPPYAVPHGTQVGGITATADKLVVIITRNVESADTVIWDPKSGRQQKVNLGCAGAAAASRDSMFFVDCEQRVVSRMNVNTLRVDSVRLPRGFTADGQPIASLDGAQAAVLIDPIEVDATNTQRLAIAYFATGRLTVLPTAATPLGWSPDGSVLLVRTPDNSAPYTLAPLGYWTAGMHDLASIRIHAEGAAVSAGFVP